MIERSWDVPRIQTNRTMRQTLASAWLKWEESGRKVEWSKIIWRDFCPNQPFFSKQSNISPVFVMLTYKCHTCLESCWKCGFFGVNCFGSSFILWAQGILLTRDPEANPSAYTASYRLYLAPFGFYRVWRRRHHTHRIDSRNYRANPAPIGLLASFAGLSNIHNFAFLDLDHEDHNIRPLENQLSSYSFVPSAKLLNPAKLANKPIGAGLAL